MAGTRRHILERKRMHGDSIKRKLEREHRGGGRWRGSEGLVRGSEGSAEEESSGGIHLAARFGVRLVWPGHGSADMNCSGRAVEGRGKGGGWCPVFGLASRWRVPL